MVNDRLQFVGLPVAASNAAKLTAFRAAPEPPCGGRICENVPPAKTVDPECASAHTMPFVCQVGRASAVNRTWAEVAVARSAPVHRPTPAATSPPATARDVPMTA